MLAVVAAVLKVRVQNLELHEKQIAQTGEHTVYSHDGGQAKGDGAGLDEEADSVPWIHGRVEGVARPDREFSVLHRHDEQQGDHEEKGQSAKSVEGHAAELQVFV